MPMVTEWQKVLNDICQVFLHRDPQKMSVLFLLLNVCNFFKDIYYVYSEKCIFYRFYYYKYLTLNEVFLNFKLNIYFEKYFIQCNYLIIMKYTNIKIHPFYI